MLLNRFLPKHPNNAGIFAFVAVQCQLLALFLPLMIDPTPLRFLWHSQLPLDIVPMILLACLSILVAGFVRHAIHVSDKAGLLTLVIAAFFLTGFCLAMQVRWDVEINQMLIIRWTVIWTILTAFAAKPCYDHAFGMWFLDEDDVSNGTEGNRSCPEPKERSAPSLQA